MATSVGPGTFVEPGYSHELLLFGIDANGYVNVYGPYDISKNGKYHISTIWNQRSTYLGDNYNGGPFFAL